MDSHFHDLSERAARLVDSHYRLLQDLIALRKKNKLSQELVGERMGITQPAVAAFEGHNSNPTLSTIRRYALAVGAGIEFTVIEEPTSGATIESGPPNEVVGL
jgi:transcriptional regulator with XRE-family HTH domain